MNRIVKKAKDIDWWSKLKINFIEGKQRSEASKQVYKKRERVTLVPDVPKQREQ